MKGKRGRARQGWAGTCQSSSKSGRRQAMQRTRAFTQRPPFVNAAVGTLLEEYSKPGFKRVNFEENVVRTIGNKRPRGIPYVELFLETRPHAPNCQTDSCIHVCACWDDKKNRDRLSKAGQKEHQLTVLQEPYVWHDDDGVSPSPFTPHICRPGPASGDGCGSSACDTATASWCPVPPLSVW